MHYITVLAMLFIQLFIISPTSAQNSALLPTSFPTKSSLETELKKEYQTLFGFRRNQTLIRGKIHHSSEDLKNTMTLYTQKGVWQELTRGLGKLSEGYLMTLGLAKLAKLVPGAPKDAGKVLKVSAFLGKGIANYISGIPVVNGAMDFYQGSQQLKKDFSNPNRLYLMMDVDAAKAVVQKTKFSDLSGKRLYYTLSVQLSAFQQLENTLFEVTQKKLSSIDKKMKDLNFFKKWILLENSRYEVDYLRVYLEYQISKNALLELKGSFVLNCLSLLKKQK